MSAWVLYRHHAGTKYHGRVVEVEAEDSDAAIKAAVALLTDRPHRAPAYGEVVALKSTSADVIHLFRLEPQEPVVVRIS